MQKNRSLDGIKTSWESRSRKVLQGSSWYNSNFQHLKTPGQSKTTTSLKSFSSHKFRSRHLPRTLVIKQNPTRSPTCHGESNSLLPWNNDKVYLSQDRLLKSVYGGIRRERSQLLNKQLDKLRQELPKVKALPESRQLLVVEDFIRKMHLQVLIN